MKIFLGSSQESVDRMRLVADWIEENDHEPLPWDDQFLPGELTLSRLIELSELVDAAAFVFAEDDQVWYRSDAVGQPRDNVLVEYGLFAGALGPERAIICMLGSPKIAVDLQGITTLDLKREHHAHRLVERWLTRMSPERPHPGSEELAAERARLKREVDGLRDRLAFEEQKFRDLQTFLVERGIVNFGDYSDSSARWRLLFDYDYFWGIVHVLEATVESPRSWLTHLRSVGLDSIAEQLSWEHSSNPSRKRLYIAKTLRVVRLGRDQATFDALLAEPVLSAEQIQQIENLGLARARVLALSSLRASAV